MNLSESGQSAADAVGIQWRDVPADGHWHEVPAEGKGPRNGAGRIRIFPDGEGGQVWNHITGDSATFWTRNDATLNPEEREARRKRAAELREQAEAERRRAADEAANLAAALWKAGRSAEGNPYLARKGVAAVASLRQIDAGEAGRIIGHAPRIGGEELIGPLLLAPIKSDGRWSSVQLIAESGKKYFLPGGALKGGFWATGPMPPGDGEGLTFLLAEGVGTALSLHEATGGLVLAAMSCGNLPAVARWLRGRYPKARIIVCSDRGNGEDHARRAAVEAGALLAVPVMDGDGTDFNDLHKAAGLDEVRRQIDAAAPPMLNPLPDEESPPSGETGSAKGHPLVARLRRGAELAALEIQVKWLIPGLIPAEAVTLFFGRGGIGKTTLAMQLLDAISRGGEIFGRTAARQPVVCVDFENSLAVLADRCRNVGAPDVLFLDSGSNPPRLDKAECHQYLDLLEQLPGAVFCFDTLRSSQSGDENDSQAMTRVMDFLRRLRDAGATVILLHHTPKASDRKYKGSGAIFDMADHVLALYPVKAPGDDGEADDDDDAAHVYRFGTSQKTRYEPDRIFLTFDAETRCFVPAPDPGDIHMDAITDAIAAIIGKDDVPTQRRIIDHLSGVVPKHKIPTLLKRGEGERWTVGKGDKKSLIYSLANSVPQKPNLYIERGFGALKTGSQISEQTGEGQGSQSIDLTLFPSSPDCPNDVGAQDILTLAAEDFEGGTF